MAYDFIDQEKDNHAIQTMCVVLDVQRSTYYKSLDKIVSNRDQENHELTMMTELTTKVLKNAY